MATFNLTSVGDVSLVNDFPKLQSYLYQLRRQLEYMFNNLDPEENYSEEARLIYVANAEKQASMEISLDQISLSMVTKDNVVSAINLSEEGVKIQGEKIGLEGVTTFNNNVTIGLDGTIHAVNGVFQGDISASTISGSTINAGGTDNGQIIVKDSSGNIIGKWTSDGIDVRDGSIKGATLELGGTENVNGTLTVRNASGTAIGVWNKDGITITNGALSVTGGGSINGSTINGATINVGGTGNVGGTINIKDANGNTIGTLSPSGVSFTNGTLTGGTINGATVNVGGNGLTGAINVKDSTGIILGTFSPEGITIKNGTLNTPTLNSAAINTVTMNSATINSGTINGTTINLGGTGNTGKMYIYNAAGANIGSWDNAGISVKAGSLDIKRGSDIGLFCNGNVFRIGDFESVYYNGRQVFESCDETTGMSGEPDESGGLYLWAGWYDDSDYAFVVNNHNQTRIKGTLLVNGTDIEEEIIQLWDAINSL